MVGGDEQPPATTTPKRGTSRRVLLTSVAMAAATGAVGGSAITALPAGAREGLPRLPPMTCSGAATTNGAVPVGTDMLVTGSGGLAIQAAVDAAPNGGVVRLPSGSVHDVDTIVLPDKDLILALQGATVTTTRGGSYAFVQRHRRRLTVLGGTFRGRGGGVHVELPVDDRQSYTFAANGVTFALDPTQTAIRLIGVREATITECFFDHCTGIVLVESVNTHVTGCQFRDCAVGVLADGSATGSPYNAGLMIHNATMLSCGYGVRALAWDWVTVVNSMIDYCDRPVQLTNVDGASLVASYLTNRNGDTIAAPVLEVLTDSALPGGPAQHVKVADSQIISRADQDPDHSVGIRLHETTWFSLSATSVHFWHSSGMVITGPSTYLQVRGNVFNPATGAVDPVSVLGTGGDDGTWILTDNVFGAPLRNVVASVQRDNV